MKRILYLLLLLVVLPVSSYAQKTGGLAVSDNGRFLQYADGTPFFYLGDTAWELFHRLNREEAGIYLEDRARKGFNVIQAVLVAEFDGVRGPNAYGCLPFVDSDPLMPDIKEGSANDYWDHVDYVIDKANSLGMYIGLLPAWGGHWYDKGAIFNTGNASAYGEFLGKRYKDKDIIWILGGDRLIENDTHKAIIRQMAEGIRRGDSGGHLMTFHPRGMRGSSEWFHDEPWLDFNMRQNGHNTDYPNYSKTYADYMKIPVKPVIDGEPLYEDHPLSSSAARNGHSVAADVRRAMYWDLFSGACGHTYGHHSVWQMYDPAKEDTKRPINNPLMSWREAIGQPGASQMAYGRRLMESRPFFTRVPAQEVIVEDKVKTSVPGAGHYVFLATRDTEGTYLMVYAPVGRKFTVRTDVIKGGKINAWWYDPRSGKAVKAGLFDNAGKLTFISPNPGEWLDWVLVLDDASKKYPAPGKDPQQ